MKKVSALGYVRLGGACRFYTKLYVATIVASDKRGANPVKGTDQNVTRSAWRPLDASVFKTVAHFEPSWYLPSMQT